MYEDLNRILPQIIITKTSFSKLYQLVSNILHFCTCHGKESQHDVADQFSSCKSLPGPYKQKDVLYKPAAW